MKVWRLRRCELPPIRGQITDERSYVDYAARAKYLELALRLKGRLNSKVEVSGADGGAIQI